MTLFSAFVLLFFVMDPLGNVPLFLAALKNVEPRRVRRVILRELLIALVAAIGFLFLGRFLLEALHVSSAALTTAGGVILLLIAIRMIFPTADRFLQRDSRSSSSAMRFARPAYRHS